MPEEFAGTDAGHSVAAPDVPKQVNPSDNTKDLPASDLPTGTLDSARTETRGRLVDPADTAVAPNPIARRSSIAPAESTELERRVLADQRALQALIAQMAETEPKFLIHLSETFCVPMEMILSEHDYTDTESDAAEFIRSVVRLGGKAARKELVAAGARRVRKVQAATTNSEETPFKEPTRYQTRQAGGIWRVTRDGRYYGDFLKKQDATAAVATDRSVPASAS